MLHAVQSHTVRSVSIIRQLEQHDAQQQVIGCVERPLGPFLITTALGIFIKMSEQLI